MCRCHAGSVAEDSLGGVPLRGERAMKCYICKREASPNSGMFGAYSDAEAVVLCKKCHAKIAKEDRAKNRRKPIAI